MVLMNASKNARNISSIVNRPCGGGDKKGGLAPHVSFYLTSNTRLIGATNTQFGVSPLGNFTNGSQVAAKKAKLGMV